MADVDGLETTALDDVQAAVEDYDDALAAGDTDRATAWFDPRPSSTRFGPEGEQWGIDEVAAVRAATAPTGTPTVLEEQARQVGDDLVLHLRVIERGGRIVQRTQLWRFSDRGWRIVHAHVSSRAAGTPVSRRRVSQ